MQVRSTSVSYYWSCVENITEILIFMKSKMTSSSIEDDLIFAKMKSSSIEDEPVGAQTSQKKSQIDEQLVGETSVS